MAGMLQANSRCACNSRDPTAGTPTTAGNISNSRNTNNSRNVNMRRNIRHHSRDARNLGNTSSGAAEVMSSSGTPETVTHKIRRDVKDIRDASKSRNASKNLKIKERQRQQ
jgi:hypothetical protein